MNEAISLVEFKVKTLKNGLNLEHVNDKIKFLNEIAKVLSKVDNTIEKEVYVDKISREYKISKEAIYAEIDKKNRTRGVSTKVLEKPVPVSLQTTRKQEENISKRILRMEDTVISLLLDPDSKAYEKLQNHIKEEDFKSEINKKIVGKLYEEFAKGNSNISNILDELGQDEEVINHITSIMADDFEITDHEKAIEDLLNSYRKEKLTRTKNEIIKQLEDPSLKKEEVADLESKLSELIIKLAKMK